ncbi:MAG: 4-(cytidine 5'-diphospho)-2-C-methyl-D-erythritol kinase [Alphaproteobacteria bacterium]|nr:4-(cytidine 5'-diphospho)-2-C-methyl-D-erythritol kinase [Alphaproteobacteria bacterium]
MKDAQTIREFAPAKLNLYLHVTGRRGDGYHDLDSLVAFASVGDEIILKPASAFSFAVIGPQAAALAHEDVEGNLAVKAARSLAALVGRDLDVALTLTKNLPVASGIGGGSSDAAAALRALARYWQLPPDDPRIEKAAALHGQDVPVCLNTDNNVYMTASGTMPAPRLPRADIVLVNPNKGLPTPAVYQEYRRGGDAFSPLSHLSSTPAGVPELADALKLRSNDLYAPACRLMPEIGDIVTAIAATPGCLLARMSGSGATCFGIYADAASAGAAAAQLRAANPDWWCEAGIVNEAAPIVAG